MKVIDYGYDAEKDVVILHFEDNLRVECTPTDELFNKLSEQFGGDKDVKEKILKKLLSKFDSEEEDYSKKIYETVNDEVWTLADLIIRQWLNNGCDGFGMKDVYNTYIWLKSIKADLIEHNLVSKSGINNFSFPLWDNYDF